MEDSRTQPERNGQADSTAHSRNQECNTTCCQWISSGSEQTFAFGQLIGRLAQKNDVLCLDGDLGAGKTVLAKGIASGLGLTSQIASPTFTILLEYPAGDRGLPLYHFDAYRLDHAGQFFLEGFDEYFDREGVSVIEWSRRIEAAVPATALQIQIVRTRPERPDERLVSLNWPLAPARLQDLMRGWENLKGDSLRC